MARQLLWTVAVLAGHVASAVAGPPMVTRMYGFVTPTELATYKNFFNASIWSLVGGLKNDGGAIAYGTTWEAVYGAGRVFEATGDPDFLDLMLNLTDWTLSLRNNPSTGMVIPETRRRDPIWPWNFTRVMPDGRTATFWVQPLFQGNIVGNIAYAAKLILSTPSLWNKTVAKNLYGYGATYYDRAKAYVRAMDLTMDAFIVPYCVDNATKRIVTTVNVETSGDSAFNQQGMTAHAFLRMAECHALLNDNPAKVAYYDSVVQAYVNWFISDLKTYSCSSATCGLWSYIPGQRWQYKENMPHGAATVQALYRTFRSGRYKLTAAQMLPLANTAYYVMWNRTTGLFANQVDGSEAGTRSCLNVGWMDMEEFNSGVYPMLFSCFSASTGRSDGGGVSSTASLLWHRQRLAKAGVTSLLAEGAAVSETAVHRLRSATAGAAPFFLDGAGRSERSRAGAKHLRRLRPPSSAGSDLAASP